MIRAILTDLEGTTSSLAFFKQTLFPFARARLAALLSNCPDDPDVAAALDEVRTLAPDRGPLLALLGWMDEDAKVTPLKALQGRIWCEGYAEGALRSHLYPDVAPHLRAWAQAGLALYVYSSGSVEAQRQLFAHTDEGDLSGLFSGFFDTRIGPKRSAASYDAIASACDLPPAAMLFLSDMAEELDAAQAAGFRVCQLVRDEDGTRPTGRHAAAADFAAVARMFGLLVGWPVGRPETAPPLVGASP